MGRVLGSINLTSPSGTVHSARWRGNDITLKKKIGTFDYPDVNGSTLQDLGVSALSYPLTLLFESTDIDGDNSQALADEFRKALAEKGEWTVLHPVEGSIKLQPVTAKFGVQPVKSLGVVKVDTTWLKPLPQFEGASFTQLSGDISATAKALPLKMATELPNPYIDGDVEGEQSFIATVKAVLSVMKSVLARFYEMNDSIRQQVALKITAVENMLESPFMVANTVLSAVNSIILIPSDTDALVTSKIRLYERLAEAVNTIGDSIDDSQAAFIKASTAIARTMDQLQVGVLSGAANSTTNGQVPSRSDAIEISNSIAEINNSFVSTSSELQLNLQVTLSKDSYFGNILGFEDMRNLTGRTIGFVLDDNYAQSVKKIITLPKTTGTLNFSIKQYPELTVEDAYQYFIETNLLSGDDLIWLAPNREVVVYV